MASAAKEGSEGAPVQPPVTDEALAQTAQGVEQDDDDEAEDEEGPQDTAADEKAGDSNSKQRKKKKSKAAAKLRKKLGLGGGDGASSSAEASSKSLEKDIPDDVVNQVRSAVVAEQGAAAGSQVNRANLAKLLAHMNLERDTLLKSQAEKAKSSTQRQIADHKFWKTQPVAKPDDAPFEEDGPIESNNPPQEVRKEAYPLPADFEWTQVDIDDSEQLKEVYELLCANYVEDDESSLRFRYSPEFLNWVLRHPGYQKNWHIGVRVKSTGKMVAFISGIPHELRVREQSFHSTEINFLCVHKKLRSKRLAPVLIKEVTRACHSSGVFQAIYTGGIVIPTPISCARYYHRTINASKLIDVGFTAVPQGMPRSSFEARYRLPKETRTKGLREMEPKDVKAVGKLLRRFVRKYDMAPRFTDQEVEHLLLSGRGDKENGRNRVVWAYVVENDGGKITDMFSFYSLPSTILDNSNHEILNAAYLFYYATDIGFSSHQTSDGSAAASSSSSAPSALQASIYSKPPEQLSTEGLAPWQKSHITGLSAEEGNDEEGVLRWDHESKEVKAKIKARLNELVNDVLIIAQKYDFDVVNCLSVMDNPLFLQEQKFGPGDGFLRFYLFNWRVKPIHGGIGGRPGETEIDPVAAYLNKQVKNFEKSGVNGGDQSQREAVQQELNRAMRARTRPDEAGSGNGVVMV